MAVTVTVNEVIESQKLTHRWKNLQLASQPDANVMKVVRLTLTGTYDTGGFAIAPNLVGMGRITDLVIIPPLAATITTDHGRFVWTGANVLISEPGAINDMVEKANASAMTLYASCIAFVFGY